MIKLQLPDNIMDSGLAMPGSTPRTLIEIDSESLPYACQCPCCGSLFNIPEGLLFKVEDDNFLDEDLDLDTDKDSDTSINVDVEGSSEAGGSSAQPSASAPAETGVGESNDTFV